MKGSLKPWPWALGGLGVLALTAAVVAAAGPHFPVTTAAAGVLFAGAAALAVWTEARGAPTPVAPVTRPEATERMTRPLVPFVVAIAATKGSCPLGYQTGYQWAVDREGRLSRPLCLPAIAAARRLTSSWTEWVAEPTPGQLARCRCPWAQAALTFEAKLEASTV